jgi:hypothetical protein
MCSFLSLTGKHLVLLGISGVDDVMTVFTSDDEGNVIMRVFSIVLVPGDFRLTLLRYEVIVPRKKLQEFLLHLVMTLNLQMLR